MIKGMESTQNYADIYQNMLKSKIIFWLLDVEIQN